MNAQTPKASEIIESKETEVDETATDTENDNIVESDYTVDEVSAKYEGDKAYSERLDKIFKLSTNWREEVMLAMVQALYTARANHDYGAATRLIGGLSDILTPVQTIQLRRWFMAFGPFKWTKLKNGFGFRKSRGADANPFNLKLAEKTPFWNLTSETEEDMEEMLNFSKAYTNVLARVRRDISDLKNLQKQLKEHPDQVAAVDKKTAEDLPAMIEELGSFVNKYTSIEVEKLAKSETAAHTPASETSKKQAA